MKAYMEVMELKGWLSWISFMWGYMEYKVGSLEMACENIIVPEKKNKIVVTMIPEAHISSTRRTDYGRLIV